MRSAMVSGQAIGTVPVVLAPVATLAALLFPMRWLDGNRHVASARASWSGRWGRYVEDRRRPSRRRAYGVGPAGLRFGPTPSSSFTASCGFGVCVFGALNDVN
jgi:hypothetical protein